MLNTHEQKIVITTLTKRRAWIKQTLESGDLDTEVRAEHVETLSHLESAMRKISSLQVEYGVVPKGPPIEKKTQRKNLTIENSVVLVADDNDESAELLASMLQGFGIKHVDIAKDGREAFDRIKNSREGYDFIFCDWDMPELSGIEVHKKAAASNTLRGAHFCMVTGLTEANKIREAIKQGVNDYIAKPIDGNKLEAKIKSTIEAKSS